MIYLYKKSIIFLYFFLILNYIKSEILTVKILSNKDMTDFSIINENIIHTGTDACVQKITDGKNIFIIKQINDASICEQFLLINDIVASNIGYYLDIPVNSVSFIPFNVASNLKIYPDRAATLHSYIKGNDLEKDLPIFLSENFTLQQKVININSPWQQQYPLDSNKQGLTNIILESMSVNKFFPKICALDTFLGNSDRSLPNIIFDKQNKNFYGIDQAASFTKKLPILAYDRINELINKNYFKNCSLEIINSLIIYKNTLQKLYEKYSPNDILTCMKELAPYLNKNYLENTDIKNRINHHSLIINDNYESCFKLINLLDKVLN